MTSPQQNPRYRRAFGVRLARLLRTWALPTVILVLGIIQSGADTDTRDPSVGDGVSGTRAPRRAIHITRGNSESAVPEKNRSESIGRGETDFSGVPVPTTRSSFIATWTKTKGAAGYRLDVSTSPRFESYVDGYRDLDVGNVTGRAVTQLIPGRTYYYRVRAYNSSGTGINSEIASSTTNADTGLIITATFDGSITSNPNAAAIEATINRAIAFYESLFSDRVTIPILFRYSSTGANGMPLGGVSQSEFAVYPISWNSYVNALRADARSSNDFSAIASLPSSALSANIEVSSANGRAIGLNTPPAIFANGTVGPGAPYDGIVTVNSSDPVLFTRPPSSGFYDAQTGIQHEIDEIMAIGSNASRSGDLTPEDLFSWSSAGIRNHTSSGTRYLSADGGATSIIGLNQDSSGDPGDWVSGPCPQTNFYVQNAFGCTGQAADIAGTSPEGIVLDILGYDLSSLPPRAFVAVMNSDGKPDYVLYNSSNRQTAVWYLNNNAFVAGAYGPTLPAGWSLIDLADFDRDGHPDFALFNSSTGQTAIWYLSGVTLLRGAYGPTIPAGWRLIATADFNNDGKPDYLLYNSARHQTAQWYLNNNVLMIGAYSGTLPSGWSVAGVADFDGDGHPDYALFNASTQQSAIWYLSGANVTSGQYGPNIAGGFQLVGAADFDGNGKPDFLLYAPANRGTAIWYLDNNAFLAGAFGPTLAAGWGWPAQ
jgi:FG-GAP-like repeat